jgi:hypothetical protein
MRCIRYTPAMRIKFAVAFVLALPLAGQTLDTEVWVGALDMRDGAFVVSGLKNISQEPGYDNQPAFYADGGTLLYTTEATKLDDSGLGVHAVRYDLATGTKTPLTGAKGFSPTPVGGDQLMVLRQGRVFLHDANGKLIREATQTNTAGYYTPFDETMWVLFMNEPERRIVLYDPRTNEDETVATGAVTAPFRIPGARAVTFVAERPFPAVEGTTPRRVLHRLDLETKRVTELATIPFETGGSHLWTSRGSLLMAGGASIYEWRPDAPGDWKVVYRSDDPQLAGISRIAIGANGTRIALVSTVAREARRKG